MPPTSGGQQLVQPLVHGRVERVARADQDGVEVLILVEVFLVERHLAVGRLGLAELADGLQAVGAQVGQDVLDPPETVRPRLDLEADGGGRP